MTGTGKISANLKATKENIIRTNQKTGLTDAEVEESRKLYGANVLSRSKGKSFLSKFLSNLKDPIIRILIFALIVNLIFTIKNPNWIESIGIAVSVLLATLISTLSECGSENAFAKLNAECSVTTVRVRRNGKVMEIPSTEIVCGDILLISAGEKIPSDGIIISGSLSLDQSALTGESREVPKYPQRSYIPSVGMQIIPSQPSTLCGGSLAIGGEGEMLVTGVGEATSLGEISKEIQEDKRKSPLKLRLSKLAGQISVIGYIAAVIVAVVYIVNAFVFDSGFSKDLIMLKLSDMNYVISTLLSALTIGLTVVVMAVPEGLPMMIAVVLSSNIGKMVKDNVLVRKSVGIETAGSLNILFTDKTGTLTSGKMGVDEVFLADLSSPSASSSPMRDIRLCARYNNSSEIIEKNVSGGNATDRAVLEYVSGMKFPENVTVTSKIPFDSARKYSSATLKISGTTGNVTYIKGAAEKILPYVDKCLNSDGEAVSFAIYREEFAKRIAAVTAAGDRVIVMAKGYGNVVPLGATAERLCLICAIILRDKLRKQAPAAVKCLKEAGIHVVMITGDNRDTAARIAEKCGILCREYDTVLTSDEMAKMSDEKISEILPRLAVVARALPSDKSRLVRLSQDAGLVAGMTGDGINDAPALRRADVGFAMGSGTQVAKDAGDIIILDNNLSSIVKAVLYGRTVFKSIRKFIVLQLTMNFCAVGVSMIGPFIGVDEPVTVVQMLWINIIMDTLGGLAFAGEAPLASYMKEKPKRRDEPILNGYMINQIAFLGGCTIAILIAFLKMPFFLRHFRVSNDNICVLTAFFALFIFSGVFNCFNARTDRLNLFGGIRKNPTFTLIMLAVCAVQIAFVYLGGSVLRTVPLTASELGFTLIPALLVFPCEFVRKIVWKLGHNRNGY